jgi:hypothetical protein
VHRFVASYPWEVVAACVTFGPAGLGDIVAALSFPNKEEAVTDVKPSVLKEDDRLKACLPVRCDEEEVGTWEEDAADVLGKICRYMSRAHKRPLRLVRQAHQGAGVFDQEGFLAR